MFKDIAKLIYISSTTTDADGFPIVAETSYDEYVEKASVKRSEFYASMQTGMRPSIVFKIRSEDFEETKHIVNTKAVYASIIEYDGARYNIIRNYTVGDGMTELVCE